MATRCSARDVPCGRVAVTVPDVIPVLDSPPIAATASKQVRTAPTSSNHRSAGILRLLDGLREGGLGILMITHDLSTAARFSDRIAVMYLGRIVEEGPASEVVRNAQHPYTRALLSVVPKRDPRERMRPQILRGEPPDAVRIPSHAH